MHRGDIKSEHRPTQCVIAANGMVIYYTLVIYRTSCALDLADFPFDRQECSLWFGSWTHNSTELDIGTSRGGCVTS